jgi:flagellar M-ring protein FliF
VLVKYAALLMATLVILFFGVRPALRRFGAPHLVAANGKHRELASGEVEHAQGLPVASVEADPARQRSQEIYNQVTEQIKREPTQSSKLLQSWIHSD